MSTQRRGEPNQSNATFDTDSKIIEVDNRCLLRILNDPSDFITELKPCGRSIKGFGGARTNNVMAGALKWRWCDDNRKIHSFTIPNSYYTESVDNRLLSPQNWAKIQRDKSEQGTGEFTNSNTCKMYLDKGKYSMTIPLTSSTNVSNIHIAPGYNRYSQYCQQAEVSDNATSDRCIIISNTAEIEKTKSDEHTKGAVQRTGSDRDLWKQNLEKLQSCEFDLKWTKLSRKEDRQVDFSK